MLPLSNRIRKIRKRKDKSKGRRLSNNNNKKEKVIISKLKETILLRETMIYSVLY